MITLSLSQNSLSLSLFLTYDNSLFLAFHSVPRWNILSSLDSIGNRETRNKQNQQKTKSREKRRNRAKVINWIEVSHKFGKKKSREKTSQRRRRHKMHHTEDVNIFFIFWKYIFVFKNVGQYRSLFSLVSFFFIPITTSNIQIEKA